MIRGKSHQAMSVIKNDAEETSGSSAKLLSTIGALAITDLVKSTLGPKGMDKVLVASDGTFEVTNDGATILKNIHIDNPAARVLVDISKTTDSEVGDGTTSVCVLAGELLREAERLLDAKIHPQIIIEGWRIALAAAEKTLQEIAFDRSAEKDDEQLEKDMMAIAMTTLSSKILYHDKEHFARIAVDAVKRLHGGALDSIHIIKKAGGSLHDSFLEEGFILEKLPGVGQPKRVEDAKVLVANTQMDADKIKIFGSKVSVSSSTQVAEIEAAERKRMLDKCQRIADFGVNVFINRQLIYNLPEQFFADHHIMAIEHADFDGVERLARVLGAEIASTFDHPDETVVGHCKLIEPIMIGEDTLMRFSGCKHTEACTIVLRGPSQHVLDEAERSLHDALCVLYVVQKERKIVCGGGCTEMEMSLAADEVAKTTPGKRALAVEAFARALRMLPTIIADNAGYDSNELVAQLRAAHASGKKTAGLDMKHGTIGDMVELGVMEPLKVKAHIIRAAAEAAEMVIRVDNIVKAAPRQRRDPRKMRGGM